MKYLEPEMSIILFDESVGTSDHLIGASLGGKDDVEDENIGEDGFTTPAYLE